MEVFDADGHINEPEAMFATLDKAFWSRRPLTATLPADTVLGNSNVVWLIEGQMLPTPGGRVGATRFALPYSEVTKRKLASIPDQTLEDIPARLKGMDQFSIDRQVVFPSMFLVNAIEDVHLEAAMMRCYNDWVGGAAAKSGGRVRWSGLVPWRDPDAAVAEVRRVSRMGACAIFTLGMVYDRTLDHPSFYPVYEAMQQEDLPLSIHFGWAAPKATELFQDIGALFCSGTVPVMWGFYYVMTSGLLGRFPGLRVGFLESGAGWAPYVIQQVRSRVETTSVMNIGPQVQRRMGEGYIDPVEAFQSGRAFINCELYEDLPYLIRWLGEGALMLSSDYPHGDTFSDETFVSKVRGREDLTEDQKAKLMGGNAARFYRK